MDAKPGTIWGRELAMVLALVQAVIALGALARHDASGLRQLRISAASYSGRRLW